MARAGRTPQPTTDTTTDTTTEATTAEFKALAHPLRLRILRLCLHEAQTNKQLADSLALDPATTLHHVRTLLRCGFLVQEPARAGARGATEKPYRATGKSWTLAIRRPDDALATVLASVDAFRAELAEAGPHSVVTSTRLGLLLSPDEVDELRDRIAAVVADFAARRPASGGVRVGLLAAVHRLA